MSTDQKAYTLDYDGIFRLFSRLTGVAGMTIAKNANIGGSSRHLSSTDVLIGRFDNWLRRVHGARAKSSQAPSDEPLSAPSSPPPDYPASDVTDGTLNPQEIRHSAGLMRVNHCGEVCAQALYRGQALTASNPQIGEAMLLAAAEERAHLEWCEQRLAELQASPSVLNPGWWLGSIAIGMAAGIAGDQKSLGFVEQTEIQVVDHLNKHLRDLPENDHKSRAIILAMREDEAAHAERARASGAQELPAWVKLLMKCQSRVMTTIAYWR